MYRWMIVWLTVPAVLSKNERVHSDGSLRSSHDLREEFLHLRKLPSLWTRSYFLSTAGNVSQQIIQRYIARQSKT